jgi:aminopeptidase YwaD
MKGFFPLIFLLLFAKSGFSQNMDRVKQTIDTLCSQTLSGRGYINNGDRKAAEFISARFETIGLKAFGNTYFQDFQFPVNTFPGEMNLKIGKHKLSPGKDFIVEAGSPSVSGSSKLYRLDTLIFSDSIASRKFLKVKCEKSILIYRQRDFARITKLPTRYLEKFYCFRQYIELQEKKLTASVSTQQSSNTTFQVLENSLPAKSKKAEYKVQAELINDYHSQNVIGIIPGYKNPDSIIVVAAHYDHLGRMGKEIYFPGANDNASGISMLLELAYYYKSYPEKCSNTMVFMAFAGEEAGLIGSHYFTENPLFPLSKIKFLLNLDLVGTGDDGITVVNGSIYTKEFDLLNSINKEKKFFSVLKKRGEAANSDHYFFHKKGVRSFFIYTLGGTTAYHDIYDKPSMLTYKGYSKLFNLLIDFVDKL